MAVKYVEGNEVSFQASPTENLLAVFGQARANYGLMLAALTEEDGALTLRKTYSMCLTYQIVSLVAFSPNGRFLVAAAMAAGHIFIMKVIYQN
jgi:hypothetical protein